MGNSQEINVKQMNFKSLAELSINSLEEFVNKYKLPPFTLAYCDKNGDTYYVKVHDEKQCSIINLQPLKLYIRSGTKETTSKEIIKINKEASVYEVGITEKLLSRLLLYKELEEHYYLLSIQNLMPENQFITIIKKNEILPEEFACAMQNLNIHVFKNLLAKYSEYLQHPIEKNIGKRNQIYLNLLTVLLDTQLEINEELKLRLLSELIWTLDQIIAVSYMLEIYSTWRCSHPFEFMDNYLRTEANDLIQLTKIRGFIFFNYLMKQYIKERSINPNLVKYPYLEIFLVKYYYPNGWIRNNIAIYMLDQIKSGSLQKNHIQLEKISNENQIYFIKLQEFLKYMEKKYKKQEKKPSNKFKKYLQIALLNKNLSPIEIAYIMHGMIIEQQIKQKCATNESLNAFYEKLLCRYTTSIEFLINYIINLNIADFDKMPREMISELLNDALNLSLVQTALMLSDWKCKNLYEFVEKINQKQIRKQFKDNKNLNLLVNVIECENNKTKNRLSESTWERDKRYQQEADKLFEKYPFSKEQVAKRIYENEKAAGRTEPSETRIKRIIRNNNKIPKKSMRS